jgi:hypothetical protein
VAGVDRDDDGLVLQPCDGRVGGVGSGRWRHSGRHRRRVGAAEQRRGVTREVDDDAVTVLVVRCQLEAFGIDRAGYVEHDADAAFARTTTNFLNESLRRSLGGALDGGCIEAIEVNDDAVRVGEREHALAGGGADVEDDARRIGAFPDAQITQFRRLGQRRNKHESESGPPTHMAIRPLFTGKVAQ